MRSALVALCSPAGTDPGVKLQLPALPRAAPALGGAAGGQRLLPRGRRPARRPRPAQAGLPGGAPCCQGTCAQGSQHCCALPSTGCAPACVAGPRATSSGSDSFTCRLQMAVVDVQRNAEGVQHIVQSQAAGPPVQQGSTIEVAVDWPRRLDHMQMHSGALRQCCPSLSALCVDSARLSGLGP